MVSDDKNRGQKIPVDQSKPILPKTTEKRKYLRSELPTMVTLKIFSKDGSSKKITTLKGILDDLSPGGVSIELAESYQGIADDQLNNQLVKVGISFPNAPKTPYILGSVRWVKSRVAKGSSFLKVGIQFEDITEDNLRAIKEFLGLGVGDQNLLRNLWDSAFPNHPSDNGD